MARRRKNATFTLDATYGVDADLIQAFYRDLNRLIPGDTPIPIPPKSFVHPMHDAFTQAYIFVDFSVRKIAPIALRAVGLEAQAAKLERLKPITNEKTARAAADAAYDAAKNAENAAENAVKAAAARAAFEAAVAVEGAYDAARAAAGVKMFNEYYGVSAEAARAAVPAAKLNPGATWAAVNEMLQAL